MILSFANHKGGCGKTACTVTAAQLLARRGKRVLVIDMDSQGNSSEALARRNVDVFYLPSVADCLKDPDKTEHCIMESWADNVFFLASNIGMESPFPSLPSIDATEHVPFIYRIPIDSLIEVIRQARTTISPDYILIDTPPSLGLATQAAIYASDHVLLPCSPAKHATFGLPDMINLAMALQPNATRHIIVTLTDMRVSMDVLGRSSLYVRFPVIGEIPRISALASNINLKKYVLSKMDKVKAGHITELVDALERLPEPAEPARVKLQG